MRRALLISILLSMALGTQLAFSEDGAEGKKLHDANCTTCHSTSVYTRPDRKVKSLAALNKQVTSCTHMAQVTLTQDEQKSVVEYLNQQFYKFK
jgi:mono/diheme cytochrome c family protein